MLFSGLIKHLSNWRSLSLIVFLAVLLLSSIIRFKPVVEGNFPFFYDHGRDMLDVKKIVEDHDFTFIGPTTGLKGLYHGPLHYYLLSIGYFFSGGNPASGVVMTVMMQLLGGCLCFFIGKRYYGYTFGLLLATLYLLALNSINASSMFWNPYWIPAFMVLFYFSIIKVTHAHGKWWLLAGFLGGVIAQFEVAFGIFIIPYLFIVGVLSEPKFYTNRYFWLSFVSFVIPFAPLIAFDIKNGMLMYKSVLSVLQGTYGALGDYIPLALRWHYRITELQRTTIDSISYYALINYVVFSFGLFGVGISILKKSVKDLQVYLLFALLPFLVFVGFMIYSSQAWSYYWIGLQVSYYFFIAYSFTKISQISTYGKPLIAALVLIFVAGSLKIVLQDNSFVSREPGIYKNQLAVVDMIFTDAGKKEFSEFVYTPPIYDYTYSYLFYWRGTRRYGYVPQKKTSLPYYFIIEPNNSRPWESIGWRKSIHGERTSVWSKKMSGDIIVEKYEAH